MENFKEFKKKYRKISEVVSKKGYTIYQHLKNKLEKNYLGKYIIIEPDSGEYFIGDDELKLIKMAKEKFPDKAFDIRKIGYKATGFLR